MYRDGTVSIRCETVPDVIAHRSQYIAGNRRHWVGGVTGQGGVDESGVGSKSCDRSNIDGTVALVVICSEAGGAAQRAIDNIGTVDETVTVIIDEVIADLESAGTDSAAIDIGAISGAVAVVVDAVGAGCGVTFEAAGVTHAVRIETVDETVRIVIESVVTDLGTGDDQRKGQGTCSRTPATPGSQADLVVHPSDHRDKLDMAVKSLAAGQDVGISVAADLDHRGAIETFVEDQVGVEISSGTAGVKLGNAIDRGGEFPPHIVRECSENCTWDCRSRIR